MRARKYLAVGALAVLLPACSQTSLLNHSYLSDNYSPYLLNYAAKRGGMVTEIIGNPFDGSKDMIEQSVTQSFEDHHFGPELDFVATPTAQATGEGREAYRVVVLFNPAPNANSAKLCSDPGRPQAPASDRVSVLAAFCTTDTRVSSAAGSVGGVSSPDDPAFRKLMEQVALELFPPRSPNRADREFQI